MRHPAGEYTSPLTSASRPVAIWISVAVLTAILMALVISAPIAAATGHTTLAFAVYGGFSKLCHQIPERSFFLAGHQFAVCARCTGLYVGFTLVTLAYPLLRSLRRTDTPARRWLFIAALPMAVDFALGFFGIWENTHFSRFSTGALLGAVASFYVIPGLTQVDLQDLRSVFTHKEAAVGSS